MGFGDSVGLMTVWVLVSVSCSDYGGFVTAWFSVRVRVLVTVRALGQWRCYLPGVVVVCRHAFHW